jgi:LysM repeat protein
MSKKMIVLLAIVTILVFTLSACERSATRLITGKATPTSEIPFPVATQPQIMVDILKGTQTAAALSLTPVTGGGLAPTKTSAAVFNTPAAVATTEPAVAATPYPTSTPGKPSSWTLQQGEFPYCIARRFNVDPVELLTLNGMNMDSLPQVGVTLKIPASGSFPGTRALKAHPTTYTVLTGETVYQIACRFGDVDPNVILAANGITAGTVLKAGQVLQIP